MIEWIVMVWCLCGFVGHLMAIDKMRKYWRRTLNEERPDCIADFFMIMPALILGPFTFVINASQP